MRSGRTSVPQAKSRADEAHAAPGRSWHLRFDLRMPGYGGPGSHLSSSFWSSDPSASTAKPWLSSEASTRRRSASRSKRSDSVVKRIPFCRATRAAEFLLKGAKPFLPSAGHPPHRELHVKHPLERPKTASNTRHPRRQSPLRPHVAAATAVLLGLGVRAKGRRLRAAAEILAEPAAIAIPRATRSSTPSSK
jgi:hypothetical protein